MNSKNRRSCLGLGLVVAMRLEAGMASEDPRITLSMKSWVR